MANSLYGNTKTNMVNTHGAAAGVVAAAAATQFISTAVPCRVVRLSVDTTNVVHFSLSSVTVSLGAIIPSSDSCLVGVDDLSKIWVFASTAASVYATYMG